MSGSNSPPLGTFTQNFPVATAPFAPTDGIAAVRSLGANNFRDEFLLFSTLWQSPLLAETIRNTIISALNAGENITLSVNNTTRSVTIGFGGVSQIVQDILAAPDVAAIRTLLEIDTTPPAVLLEILGGGALEILGGGNLELV